MPQKPKGLRLWLDSCPGPHRGPTLLSAGFIRPHRRSRCGLLVGVASDRLGATGELFDLARGGVEFAGEEPVGLLAASQGRDRSVEGGIAALEPLDDLLE